MKEEFEFPKKFYLIFSIIGSLFLGFFIDFQIRGYQAAKEELQIGLIYSVYSYILMLIIFLLYKIILAPFLLYKEQSEQLITLKTKLDILEKEPIKKAPKVRVRNINNDDEDLVGIEIYNFEAQEVKNVIGEIIGTVNGPKILSPIKLQWNNHDGEYINIPSKSWGMLKIAKSYVVMAFLDGTSNNVVFSANICVLDDFEFEDFPIELFIRIRGNYEGITYIIEEKTIRVAFDRERGKVFLENINGNNK